jgi:HD domain
MADAKLRHAIALEAARLMYDRSESEYFTAKKKAAKRLCRGYVKPSNLPSNAEVRELVQLFARTNEGERRTQNLQQMRLRALWLMRRLCRFRPRLIGSVLTGHTRKGSDIDLHLFSDYIEPITTILEDEGLQYDVEHKRVTKHGEARIFIHIHVYDVFNFELTVYAENLSHFVFKSSITGKAIERVSIAELEQFLEQEYPNINIDETLADQDEEIDPYQLFRLLLLPLEKVRQSAKYHPEGDALYHTLQVFELAKDMRPWDEEFLLAALLHDVGKGLDPVDHVNAALQALDGLITERTAWLIANHMLAHEVRGNTLGVKARRRLEEHEDFEELMLLNECDVGGRVPGAHVGTVEEALAFIREVERSNRGK